MMALTIGFGQPSFVMAAQTIEMTEQPVDDTQTIKYITSFVELPAAEGYLQCMYKPALEELLGALPETIPVQMEGEDTEVYIAVTWECEEDFDNTMLSLYTFYPKWDETLYPIAESAVSSIVIPSITVEVPAGGEGISDLQGAGSSLQEILKKKSILALVFLCDRYEVKENPSPGSAAIGTAVCGQSVQITDVGLDEEGAVWYQVLFYQNGAEYKGYIQREFLATSDEDFMAWEETWLNLTDLPMTFTDSAGYPDVEQFPASYQNALYALKEKHPNWVFVRMDTGLDWNTVIKKEMGDKSLIHSSTSGSWQNGVYGQGWSYASEGILKYYMDPRNFLTDPSIFQFEQLTYNSSYHTTNAVQEILKNSFMSSSIPGDSQTYAQAFTGIGQSLGISPFHLASRVLQEQGSKGTSMLISGTYPGYEGYFNYFNVGASGKTDAQVVQSGLKKAKDLGWNTRYKSLYGGSSVIGANYILKGQDTLYLEKFNVSNGQHANFTHQYMQNIQAPDSEASNIRKAYNNAGALENSFVFKIPVYNNMPASACSKPEVTDSITLDKTTISSLEVNKTAVLVPYVNGSKVDYVSNMTFFSSNTSVASVDAQGKITAIAPGTATISCTRSGANTAACTVTVVKANPTVTTPVISPLAYKEGLKLSDIALPAGWAWSKGSTEIAVGTFSYSAVYTPTDTTKYNTITKEISFTVTKSIPVCKVPENLEGNPGDKLGSIVLPGGFVWESDPETELTKAGEYTYYVSYNPDEKNYYTVSHIPVIVRVTGNSTGGSGTGGNTSTGSSSSGSTSGGSTSGGNGTGGNTSTGSTSNGSTSGGSSTDGNTSTGSTSSGSSSGGGSTGGSTSTGSSSGGSTSGGNGTGGNTSTGSSSSGSTSGGSTSGGNGTGGNTSDGSTSGGSTPGGNGAGGNTSTGSSSSGSTSGGSTSGGNGAGGNTSTGSTSSGSTSGGSSAGGNTSTGSSSSGSTTGGSTSNGSTTDGNTTTGGSSNGSTAGGDTTTGSSSNGSTTGGNTSNGSTAAGNGSNGSTAGGNTPNGSTTTGSGANGNAAGGNTPNGSAAAGNGTNGNAAGGNVPGGSTPAGSNSNGNEQGGSSTAGNTAGGNASNGNTVAGSTAGGVSSGSSVAGNNAAGGAVLSGAGGSTGQTHVTESSSDTADGTLIIPPVTVVEESQEEVPYKPAVTIQMEDTTILTSEKLQMAKEQNIDIRLDMGDYVTWGIDIDSVDMDAFTEVDMGVILGTDRVPRELIAEILNGNKYIEITLAHDGAFDFEPILNVALNPENSGRYANLFYFDPEISALEFLCDSIIDANGIASFKMDHASVYVIIVSDYSMSGMVAEDEETGSVIRWIMLGVFIFMVMVVIGYAVFFYYRKRNSMEDDDESEDEEDFEDGDESEDEEDDDFGDEEGFEKGDDSGDEEDFEEDESEDEEDFKDDDRPKKEEEPAEDNKSDNDRAVHNSGKREDRNKAGKHSALRDRRDAENTGHAAPKAKPVMSQMETDADEDDWIEDQDWHEPELPVKKSTDRFADDHAEDDWIDDDEWDIGNDWMDDTEWEQKNKNKKL